MPGIRQRTRRSGTISASTSQSTCSTEVARPRRARNLGNSIRTNEPVTKMLLRRLPISLYVGFAGLLVGVVIGLSAAIISALRPGSRLDITRLRLRNGRHSAAEFLAGALLVYVFAVLLHWVPPSGYTSPFANLPLSLQHARTARDCARNAFGSGHHAAGALGADGSAGAGLHHHGARERIGRAARHRPARAEERHDPDRHDHRLADRANWSPARRSSRRSSPSPASGGRRWTRSQIAIIRCCRVRC